MKKKSNSQQKLNFKKSSGNARKVKDMATLTISADPKAETSSIEVVNEIMSILIKQKLITGYNVSDEPKRVEEDVSQGIPVITYAISTSEGVSIEQEKQEAIKRFGAIAGEQNVVTSARETCFVWDPAWGEIPETLDLKYDIKRPFGSTEKIFHVVGEKAQFIHIFCTKDKEDVLKNALNFFKKNLVRYVNPPTGSDKELQKHADFVPYLIIEGIAPTEFKNKIPPELQGDFGQSTMIKFNIGKTEQEEKVISFLAPAKLPDIIKVFKDITQRVLTPEKISGKGGIERKVIAGDFLPEIIEHSILNFVFPQKQPYTLFQVKNMLRGKEIVQ